METTQFEKGNGKRLTQYDMVLIHLKEKGRITYHKNQKEAAKPASFHLYNGLFQRFYDMFCVYTCDILPGDSFDLLKEGIRVNLTKNRVAILVV